MRRDQRNQPATKCLRARGVDLGPDPRTPYGPATSVRSHLKAGHMSAPDDASKMLQKPSCAKGGYICCRTLTVEDSHRESVWLDGANEQAIPRPLPHDELVQLLSVAAQARVCADLAGQGHDLARAA